MKKTKILTVLGVLLAMGITACGGSKASSKSEEKSSQSQQPASSSVAPAPASSSEPASTPDTSAPEQGSSSSSSAVAHVHVWNLPNKDELEEEYAEVDQAPTCTAAGQKTWYCECGETKTESIKKLGHDFGEWTVKTPATCTVDGKEERECSRCHEKEEQVIKAAHDWDTAQEVAAGTDPANQVAYTLASCKVCHAIKAEILAKDAKFYKGGIKSGTPSSSFKLNSKNDKAYWRFTVAGTKMYKGMLYQYAAMDQWSGNTDRSYAQTSTSGDHAPTYPLGNFDAMVNGDRVDKTQWIDTPYSELLAEGDDSSELMGDNYSPVALAPMGECVIQPGTNEITYERLGSYNLIINKLVFIGTEYEHTHAAATEWSSDADNHWHACTAMGCPTKKADTPVAHTFEDKAEDARNKAATCSEKGAKVEKCSVCGYEKVTPIDEIPHTYPNEGAYTLKTPATCEAAGEEERECEVCHAKDTRTIAKLAHDFSGGVAQSYPAVTEGENQHIAADAYNCELCGKSALRWNARNFDATLSSTGLDLTHDGDKSVRFASGAVENKDGAAAVGSHIVYKINVGEDVAKAGLSFKIKNTNGSGWGANAVAPVFGLISGDSSLGAIDNGDGTYTTATHRYGLKVNGVEYFLGEDSYGNKAGVTDWFDWPVEFPLTAGVNTIDVFAYAGYRADFYEFQVTGLPHVEPAHTHVLGEWQSDDNNHWKLCTAEGCLDPEGTKYENNPHDFGEVQVVTPATHASAGAGTKTCATCGKVVDVVIPKVAHEWAEGTAVANTDSKNVIPLTCSCGKVGAKISENDYSSASFDKDDDKATDAIRPSQGKAIVYKIVVSKAGNYSLEFGMFCKSNDTVVMSQRNFSVKVNAAAATVTLDGTTTPKALGMTSTNAVQVELCASIPLNEGENTIEITCASYRLHYKGNLVVAEL